MRAAVVTFPGSNGDYDLFKAVQLVGCEPHFVWHRDRGGLKEYDAVLLPGGFSYGDYLRAGAIASLSPIMEDVIAFAKRNLAGPKVPREIRVVPDLPKNPTGKVLKRELRELA